MLKEGKRPKITPKTATQNLVLRDNDASDKATERTKPKKNRSQRLGYVVRPINKKKLEYGGEGKEGGREKKSYIIISRGIKRKERKKK